MLTVRICTARSGTSSMSKLLLSVRRGGGRELARRTSMKRIYVLGAAALMASVGIAVAQQSDTKPGSNLSPTQGPCAQGYDRAAPGGRMQLSSTIMKNVDTNNDGNISKSEFDNACARGLFEETKKH